MLAWQELNTSTVRDRATRDALDAINLRMRDYAKKLSTLSGSSGGSGSGGATQSYITVVNEATLANERALAVQSPITKSDGGPNSALTIGIGTAVPSGGYGTTALAGSAGSVIRSDAQFKYPNSLMSDANSTLVTLSDTGTEQVLTFGVGNTNVQLASGGGIILKGDITTGPLTMMTVQMRPGTGVTTGILSSITAAGAITSATASAWNANQAYGNTTFTTATLAAYRIQAISAQPNASSDANNKLYGFLGATPSINSTNGGWLEVAGALIPGPSRAAGNPSVTGDSAGIITECSTVGTTVQYGIKVRQRTAGSVATDRIGVDIDAQNSGTNRLSLRCADVAQLAVSTESYTPGSFTVPDGRGCVLTKRLQLTGSQRATVLGTGRLRIT